MKNVLKVRLTPQTRITRFNSEKSQFWRDCDQHYKEQVPLRAERRRLFKQSWDEWCDNARMEKRKALGQQPYAQGHKHVVQSYYTGGELKRTGAS